MFLIRIKYWNSASVDDSDTFLNINDPEEATVTRQSSQAVSGTIARFFGHPPDL